jgi:hypothetical protein
MKTASLRIAALGVPVLFIAASVRPAAGQG